MAPPEPEPTTRYEKRQMILNFFLAFIGIVWAVVFGIFSILAWKSSEKANELAEFANLIALADMCDGIADTESSALKDICNAASSPVLSSFAARVSATFLPSATAQQGLDAGTKAGIGIAVAMVCVSGILGLGTMCIRFRPKQPLVA